MGSEVKIKDLDPALLANLSDDDLLYLIQGNTNIDNNVTLGVLYNYILAKINNESFNSLIDTRLANVFSPNKIFNKNLIINGDFRIWQRNTTFALTTSGTTYTADRWALSTTTPQGNFTVSRTTGLDAYVSAGMACRITSNASSAPGNLRFRQIIEGFNCGQLQWGTPNAKPLTIQFKVYASQAGTYALHIQNNFLGANTDRSYVTTFTVNAANTYETKTITIPGCIDGIWNKNTAFGILIGFDLGSSSNSTSTLNSWLAGQFFGTPTAISIGSTIGAYIEFGDIQAEVGSNATTYEYLPYELSLLRCQRYYAKSYNINVFPGEITSDGSVLSYVADSASTTQRSNIEWPVRMRVTPTVICWNTRTGASGSGYDSSGATPQFTGAMQNSEIRARFQFAPTPVGRWIEWHYTVDAEL